MKTLWKISLPKTGQKTTAEMQSASRQEDMLNQNFKALYDAVTVLEKSVAALQLDNAGEAAE